MANYTHTEPENSFKTAVHRSIGPKLNRGSYMNAHVLLNLFYLN